MHYFILKTTISIPDQIFDKAEQFALEKNMTRSALFTKAVDEFIQRHHQKEVTAKLNKIYLKQDSSLDPLLAEIQAQSIPKEEW